MISLPTVVVTCDRCGRSECLHATNYSDSYDTVIATMLERGWLVARGLENAVARCVCGECAKKGENEQCLC